MNSFCCNAPFTNSTDRECSKCGAKSKQSFMLPIILTWSAFMLFTFMMIDMLDQGFKPHIASGILLSVVMLVLAWIFWKFIPIRYVIEAPQHEIVEGVEVIIYLRDKYEMLIRSIVTISLGGLLVLIINTFAANTQILHDSPDLLLILVALSFLLIPFSYLSFAFYRRHRWQRTKATLKKVNIFHNVNKVHQDQDDYKVVYYYAYQGSTITSSAPYKTFQTFESAKAKLQKDIKQGIEILYNPNNPQQSSILVDMEPKSILLSTLSVMIGIGLLLL